MGDLLQAKAVRFNRQLENERESDRVGAQATRAKQARIADMMAATRSGKPIPRQMADAARDRKIFNSIRGSVASGDIVRLTPRSGPSVTDIRTDKRRKRANQKQEEGGLIVTGESTFWTPHWEHAGDTLKAMAWGMAMHERGSHAFTAHMRIDVLSSASSHADGFARYMQEEISRHLRRAFKPLGFDAPDFFFQVEAGHKVDPHLHGVIHLPADPRALKVAKKAIREACGPCEAQSRQVDIRPMTKPLGWVGYMSKWKRGTQLLLQDANVLAATHGVRQSARAWYERVRRTGEDIGVVARGPLTLAGGGA